MKKTEKKKDMDVMNRALQSTFYATSKGAKGKEVFQSGSIRNGVSGIEKGSTPSAFASEERVKSGRNESFGESRN